MEIEVELSLCINLLVNSLILKLAGLFLKQEPRLWFLSALIGSAIALILPMFSLNWYFKVLIIIFVCNIMLSISFKFKSLKNFICIFSVIILSTFLFGGAMQALTNVFGQFPLFVVFVIAFIIYIISKIIIKSKQKRDMIQKYTYNVVLKDDDKVIYEEGYLDSGNVLYDNITKKPIILITFDVFNKLYSNINYINAYTKNFDKKEIKDGHFVKIKNVGGFSSILVFRIDELQVGNEKSYKDALIGLTFSSFEKSFGKKILLNSAVI